MKKTIVLLSVVLLASAACKKSNTTTSGGGGTNTTQSTTISNGFGAAGTNNINGVFIAEMYSFPSYSLTTSEGRASLFKTARSFGQIYLTEAIMMPGDSAGHLKLNSTTMVRDTGNSPFIYTDTTSAPNYSGGVTWNLTGNANFAAFSTHITRGFPVVANQNFIPATFSKSQNLTLNLGSAAYTNTDSIMVLLYTSSSTAGGSAIKYVAGNTSSVTFTPAEMSNLITNGTFNEVVVVAKNFSNMSAGGKNYVFIMDYNVGAFVTVTP